MGPLIVTCRAALIVAGAICVHIAAARADEVVTFSSARYLVGELTQRLAQERGETIERAPAEIIKGYLSRPSGSGPLPAIVVMHGCGGLSERKRLADARQFTDWGYVTLEVDSFATRGIKTNCLSDRLVARDADALGALAYLSKLPFVDPKRIALAGYSQGGIAVLEVASVQPIKLFETPAGLTFKAAVAYYPICGPAADELTIPTLVLVGELDDWSPAAACRRMMKRQNGKGVLPTLVVFPEAYHSFDNPKNGYGIRYFGHWLRYNADATERAAALTRSFLAEHLGP
jgi:dienelactone hydrolase